MDTSINTFVDWDKDVYVIKKTDQNRAKYLNMVSLDFATVDWLYTEDINYALKFNNYTYTASLAMLLNMNESENLWNLERLDKPIYGITKDNGESWLWYLVAGENTCIEPNWTPKDGLNKKEPSRTFSAKNKDSQTLKNLLELTRRFETDVSSQDIKIQPIIFPKEEK